MTFRYLVTVETEDIPGMAFVEVYLSRREDIEEYLRGVQGAVQSRSPVRVTIEDRGAEAGR